MNVRRLWAIAGALGSIAILAIGWFAVASPLLTAASDARTATAETEAQNLQLEADLEALKAGYDDIDSVLAELAEHAQSIPATPDYREFLAQLDAIQAQTGHRFANVTFGDVIPYAPAVTAPDETGAPLAGEEEAADAPATEPSEPAPTPPATAGVAPVAASDVALVGQGAFYLVPVSISVYGGVAEAYDTVARLRELPRLFLVTQIGAVEAANGDGTSSINGYIFVLVDPHAAARESAEDAAEAPDATPTP